MRDRKQTALLVTHTALDALVLADRVVVLGEGAVVEEGPTREVLARPRSAFTARIAGLDLVPGIFLDGDLRTADGLTVAGRATDVENGEAAVAVFRGRRPGRRARGRPLVRRQGHGSGDPRGDQLTPARTIVCLVETARPGYRRSPCSARFTASPL